MNEIIAYCGLDCLKCPIYQVAREKNKQKRDKMRIEIAQQIKKQYGTEIKPKDVTGCDGCKTESGRLFSGSKQCQIRKCARDKGLENCAYCSDYTCDKLEKFFVTDPDAKRQLDQVRSTL